MSRSQLAQTPGPLLSRFEKYILSVEQVRLMRLYARCSRRGRTQILHESPPQWQSAELNRQMYRVIYDGVNDFVARNHEPNGQLLYGAVPRETAASLIKSLPAAQKPEVPVAFGVPTPVVNTAGTSYTLITDKAYVTQHTHHT